MNRIEKELLVLLRPFVSQPNTEETRDKIVSVVSDFIDREGVREMTNKEIIVLQWLTGYIRAIEEADTSCEQKLILPELKAVRAILSPPRIKRAEEPESEMKKILAEMSKEYKEMNGFSRSTLNRFLELSKEYKGEKDIDKGLCQDKPLIPDFMDEFIAELQHQLRSDYARWGNTWLDRPRFGQVSRTSVRYNDYFDQFYAVGRPVPWMKVIGGALICWIRDNHPELCSDSNECEDVGKPPESSAGVFGSFTHPGDAEKPVEEMTTKEVIESEETEQYGWTHVEHERVKGLQGWLAYVDNGAELMFNSVLFIKGIKDGADIETCEKYVLGVCDEEGIIKPQTKPYVKGRVFSNGQYRFSEAAGLLSTDEIYVSYDYRFPMPT